MNRRLAFALLLSSIKPNSLIAQRTDIPAPPAPVMLTEFIGEHPKTPTAHASTIVETLTGLVAAWFGGTREGATDVGIWMSRMTNGSWSDAVEVANGIQPDGTRFPCYNPVLFRSRDDVLHLFYKVGPQPAKWWGMHRTSRDGGKTWSKGERLPKGIIGPVKNKPVMLRNGTIISGSSTESIDATPTWRVHFEISRNNAKTWSRVVPAAATGPEIEAIQPSVLMYADGSLQALGRTRSSRLFETWSRDNGKTWTALALTTLPNPNAGADAVTLNDGRQLIVYNHSTTARSPLNVALSRDGKNWNQVIVLEDAAGEYSYPAVIQTGDGLVHITYTWHRQRIKHVVIDPMRLDAAR